MACLEMFQSETCDTCLNFGQDVVDTPDGQNKSLN